MNNSIVVPLKPIQENTLPNIDDIEWCVVEFSKEGLSSISKSTPRPKQIKEAYELLKCRYQYMLRSET